MTVVDMELYHICVHLAAFMVIDLASVHYFCVYTIPKLFVTSIVMIYGMGMR